MHRRKEINEKYRCGSRIVCAWSDIRTVECRNVIWLESHQDFISRSYLNQFVLYSYRAPIGYYFFTLTFFLLALIIYRISLFSHSIDIVDSRTSHFVRSFFRQSHKKVCISLIFQLILIKRIMRKKDHYFFSIDWRSIFWQFCIYKKCVCFFSSG